MGETNESDVDFANHVADFEDGFDSNQICTKK
ncbi:uncharacterized protein G2W53_015925 [Senna tora]|uniref:Uncharacterized protein n=1 Tax=Senna tora TaxID=362788 RepID=A0A834WWN1_9FABA|nr:uncharacterized protein G2W53_015925 [Senna tora]